MHFPQPGPRDHNQSSFKGGTIIWGHVGDHMILCSVDVSCLRIGIPPELGSREKLRIFCRTLEGERKDDHQVQAPRCWGRGWDG